LSFLIDTNIISEVRKGPRCDRQVAAWYASIADSDLYLSVLVLGEIRKAVEAARPADPAKAEALAIWLDQVRRAFDGRILSIDYQVAMEWGRISALKNIPMTIGLLAASAKINGMTLVTSHDDEVKGLGVRVFNPFVLLTAGLT
jgi:predicted nucleic acid-binding protein